MRSCGSRVGALARAGDGDGCGRNPAGRHALLRGPRASGGSRLLDVAASTLATRRCSE